MFGVEGTGCVSQFLTFASLWLRRKPKIIVYHQPSSQVASLGVAMHAISGSCESLNPASQGAGFVEESAWFYCVCWCKIMVPGHWGERVQKLPNPSFWLESFIPSHGPMETLH